MTPADNESQPLRIIGTPVKENGVYILHEFALIGRECGWICPQCNNEVRICPSEAGGQTFTCSVCNASFQVTVDSDADTFLPTKKPRPAMGMLIAPDEPQPDEDKTIISERKRQEAPVEKVSTGFLQWGGLFSRKKFSLRQGANTIGRKDSKTPSDLQLEDPEMSRRSVCIEATPDEKGGYEFTLTIMKSLNPVKVNGKVMEEGYKLKLRNGDSLTMGKTSFTFKTTK